MYFHTGGFLYKIKLQSHKLTLQFYLYGDNIRFLF